MFLSPELLDSRSITAFSLGTVTPASTAAAVCAEQTFSVPLGTPALRTTDAVIVMVNTPSGNAVSIASARVISATQIGITFCNPTAGALTHAAGIMIAFVVRP